MNKPYKPYDCSTLIKKDTDPVLTCLTKQIDSMEARYQEDREERRKQIDLRRDKELMKEELPVQKKIKKNVGVCF